MSRIRLISIAGIALAALLFVAVPAEAGGGGSSLTITATCNTTTGEYDLLFTLYNVADTAGDITVEGYEVDSTDPPKPTFSPDPIASKGNSTATDSVPGDTTYVWMRVNMFYTQLGVDVDDDIYPAGDCVAAPTTTTTSTTVAPTTTLAPTTTAAAAAVAAAPTFTG